MKVEFQVVIRPEMALPLTLTRSEAKELYDALHAEFGDFDQARELSQLARESVAREMRLAELEAEVKRLKSAGVDDADISALTSPTLEDDIAAMIAARKNDPNHIAGANKMADDAEWAGLEEFKPVEPSNTPEPPAEPEKAPEPPAPSNERQVAPLNHSALVRRTVDVWERLRNRYPQESHAKTITRIGWSFGKASERPRSEQIRAWLREGGVAVEEPPSVGAVAAIARAARATINAPKHGPKPPLGYRIVDAEAWKASAPMLNESEIRELAEGGLARIGLAVAA